MKRDSFSLETPDEKLLDSDLESILFGRKQDKRIHGILVDDSISVPCG